MPYTPHWLLAYGGTLGTAGEIWSNGIRLHSAADLDSDPDPDDYLDGATAACQGLIEQPLSKIPTYVKLTYVKFNKIGADGLYVSNTESNTRFLEGPEAVSGGVNSPLHPYSVSCAVTWRTAFQRGRGSKGRVFSPGVAAAVGPDGQFAQQTTQDIATAYAAFLTALKNLNSVPGDALVPVVASGINGAVNPITSVSVGSVPDTMRSRRNQLVETRASVNVS